MQYIQRQDSQDNFMTEIEIALIIERKNSENKKEQFIQEYLYIEDYIYEVELPSTDSVDRIDKDANNVVEIQL